MKFHTLIYSKNNSVKKRLWVLPCLAISLFATSSAIYAQDDVPLVPGAEAAADVPLVPEAPADSSADDLLLGEGEKPTEDVPEGAEGEKPAEDEFSFDDTIEEEKSPEDIEKGFRKQAFEGALDEMMPLRPEEIRTVLEHYDRTIQSTEIPVHPYPRPELTVQNISLDPGSPPLIVKMSFGYVTTLSILDESGAPWPIEDMSWVGDFEIHEDSPKDLTHMLRISPSSNFAHGNISMRLMGLDTPVIMTLETNRDIVHYRFDAVVPKEGPNTKTPIIDPGPTNNLTLSSGDVDMSLALGGVIPEDATKMTVSGVDGRTSAYNYNGLTYVRTPLTLLSPGWESSVASADGTRVYALQEAPVLILSDKGRMVRAHLSEVEESVK